MRVKFSRKKREEYEPEATQNIRHRGKPLIVQIDCDYRRRKSNYAYDCNEIARERNAYPVGVVVPIHKY